MYSTDDKPVNTDDGKPSPSFRVGGRHKPFAQLANDMLRDKRLALDERGLLAYMLSHREGWSFSERKLQEHTNTGRDKIRRILNSLAGFGYLKREQTRNENGTLGPCVYSITDEPDAPPSTVAGKPVHGSPETGQPWPAQPRPDKASTENPATKNTIERENTIHEDTSQQAVVARGRANNDQPAGFAALRQKLGRSDFRPGLSESQRSLWASAIKALLDESGMEFSAKHEVTKMLECLEVLRLKDKHGVLADSCFTIDALKPLLAVDFQHYGSTMFLTIAEIVQREKKPGKIRSWRYFSDAVHEEHGDDDLNNCDETDEELVFT